MPMCQCANETAHLSNRNSNLEPRTSNQRTLNLELEPRTPNILYIRTLRNLRINQPVNDTEN